MHWVHRHSSQRHMTPVPVRTWRQVGGGDSFAAGLIFALTTPGAPFVGRDDYRLLLLQKVTGPRLSILKLHEAASFSPSPPRVRPSSWASHSDSIVIGTGHMTIYLAIAWPSPRGVVRATIQNKRNIQRAPACTLYFFLGYFFLGHFFLGNTVYMRRTNEASPQSTNGRAQRKIRP